MDSLGSSADRDEGSVTRPGEGGVALHLNRRNLPQTTPNQTNTRSKAESTSTPSTCFPCPLTLWSHSLPTSMHPQALLKLLLGFSQPSCLPRNPPTDGKAYRYEIKHDIAKLLVFPSFEHHLLFCLAGDGCSAVVCSFSRKIPSSYDGGRHACSQL